jgi:glycosyltransferase involved in cell wall biosynthesis
VKVLFIHPKAPGQFARLFEHFLNDESYEIVVFHMGSQDLQAYRDLPAKKLQLVDLRLIASLSADQKPYLRGLDDFIRSATAALSEATRLAAAGWIPDIVYSHTGFGLGAFVHNAFQDAVFVKYCEWFYRNAEDGAEFFTGPQSVDRRVGTELLNGPILWDLMRADLLIAPTIWQRRQFPSNWRKNIEIVPDGIDTSVLVPDSGAEYTLPTGKSFCKGDRVVTYVGRGADPFRGFRQFVEALEILQRRDPLVEAIIVGDQLTYYGPKPGTDDYFNSVMARVNLDLSRTHFVGTIPYRDYIKVLQISSVHTYLTAPFVLSWSAIEAMSCGCAIVASDNEPVWDLFEDGEHGLLAAFNDPAEIAATITRLLDDDHLRSELGHNARRRVVQEWDLTHALATHLELIRSAIDRRPSFSIEKHRLG